MPDLEINGVRLYYQRSGRGEPLLLLHGLGSSVLDWERQVDVFSTGFEVITLDLRGHGRSGKPPGPYSLALFAADVNELVQTLRLGPVHVLGLSMGGMVAFQWALDYPQSARSLIIVNSGPELVPRGWRERWQFTKRRWIVRMLGMRRMGKVLAEQLLPEPDQETLRAAFVERWAANEPRAYLQSLRAIVGWSVAGRISQLQIPCLIISGDADYTPVAAKRAYAARIPGAEVVEIANSRHMTPIDQPSAFNQAVLEFLARQTRQVSAGRRSS
jgi:3-oxoadipate enol-lactonase